MNHGHSRGGKMSPTYSTWSSVKQRCTNEKHPRWTNYGGQGITMDDSWIQSFQAFLDDMGPRPEGRVLGRIDPHQGYFKDNCHWVTPGETQLRKRPSNRHKDALLYDPNRNPYFVKAGELTNFCRVHGLTTSGLSLTLRGKHKQHKGWTGHYVVEKQAK